MSKVPFLLFFLLAQPFWESRHPSEWTSEQLASMLTDSPWAQGIGPAPVVPVILATALPLQEAEAEMARRSHRPKPTDPDYTDFLAEHRDTHFVLAIPYNDLAKLGRAEDERRLEEETVMRVGRKQWKIAGHFPPTPSDPVLRLIFPRSVTAQDKSVTFELFLPGITNPARIVEFRVKDLMYHGKLEM